MQVGACNFIKKETLAQFAKFLKKKILLLSDASKLKTYKIYAQNFCQSVLIGGREKRKKDRIL